jgi:hypothetical protein
MNYTVWRHGVLLGRTDLAMPGPGPNWRAGQLEPTIEFERAWSEFAPTIEEFIAAGMAMGTAVADMPPPAADDDPAERGRQVYERLSGHPSAPRLRAASEALAALGLELRDATGGLVATEFVMVQEVRPPAWVPAAAIARDVEEARRAGLEIRVPAHIVVVQNATGARGPSSASRPPA